MRNLTTGSFILALGLFSASCNNPDGGVENDSLSDATEDTAVVYQDERGRIEADGMEIKQVGEGFWRNVDFNAPMADNTRLRNAGVERRQGQGYQIFDMDEKILFDLDKSELRAGADEKLRSIAESINELPDQGDIRIYGHTDSIASREYNMKLSEDRANAVKNWLQNNTDIDASRMSIQAMGQSDPRATNETAAGRQKNRRVAIVVATNQGRQGQTQQGQQGQMRQ